MKTLASRYFLLSTVQLGLLLLALNLAQPETVSAQDLDNVTITGRVLDPNGAIIPGATIEAVLVKMGASRAAVSDVDGRYRIIQLEPGVYNLRASFAGFARHEKQELSFIAGKNVQLDFTLVPQGV